MPAWIIALTEASHKTGIVHWLTISGMTECGEVPAYTGPPEQFMYTSHFGGLIRAANPLRAWEALAVAGAMRGVWKAPELVTSLAWSAPFAFTSFSSFSMAALVPPQVAPLGNSAVATWHTVPAPISFRTCLQKPSSLSRLMPATESSACASPLVEASAKASARIFASSKPSRSVKTPAATSAVSSPMPRPATAPGRAATSGACCFSFSRPARPATSITG
mmetsp:Transcript_36658/g.85295  ORF Transcript_36658/g.85295 Transcript_36658/m.85295 type:complete len:220 (+) Transcript_36658:185-844(+)